MPKRQKTWRCDPDKNHTCAKDNCYRGNYGRYCRLTLDRKYRMLNPFKRFREWLKYDKFKN